MKIYKWWERPGWRQTCFTPRGPNCKSHSLAAIHKPNCNPKSEPRIIWLFSKLSCQIILSWWPICPDDSAHEFYLKQTWLLLTIGRAPWSNNKTRFLSIWKEKPAATRAKNGELDTTATAPGFFPLFGLCKLGSPTNKVWNRVYLRFTSMAPSPANTIGAHCWQAPFLVAAWYRFTVNGCGDTNEQRPFVRQKREGRIICKWFTSETWVQLSRSGEIPVAILIYISHRIHVCYIC